jgi:hypothetical protein
MFAIHSQEELQHAPQQQRLAAFYCCVQENHGERAVRSAGEGWLHLLESRLMIAGDLPGLVRITAEATVLFAATQ